MNTLTSKRLERFKRVISGSTKGFAIIIAQVDPDAIGSALALSFLIKQLRGGRNDITIYYCGAISHPQNQAAVVRYNLTDFLQPIKNWKPDEKRHIALVDSSKVVDTRLGFNLEASPMIVIDHHCGRDVSENKNSFVWVENIGSTSTMMVELMSALKVDFMSLDPVITTMLALGIRTDTDNLLNGNKRDREAQHLIESFVNDGELKQLFKYPLPPEHFRNLKRALDQVSQKNARLVTQIGVVTADMGDDVSTIADFFIRQVGVTLVVVWCILKGEKKVRISARNTDNSLELGAFLKDRIGQSCGAKVTQDGGGIGGGNLTLDLGCWLNENTTEEVVALVSAYITKAVFRD